jgi:predicted phosphodiesterase
VRILFLSDIHGNYEALQAVLKDAASRDYDRVIFLGDAVGYGPQPVEVLETLEGLGANCIIGNHDEWLLQISHGGDYSQYGLVGMVLNWQLKQLGPRHLSLIRTWVGKRTISLEDAPKVTDRLPPEFLIIHGSPRSAFEYTDSLTTARAIFAAWPDRLAFVGHTHVPGIYATLEGPVGDWTRHHAATDWHTKIPMPPKARWIVNPGSVGQPRDGNPKASYGILDLERGVMEFHRVDYNIEAVQALIHNAGLPEGFGARLTLGR